MTTSMNALALQDYSILTIDAGVVTATASQHTIAAETGVADLLDTITAGHSNLSSAGITFRPWLLIRADTGDTITVKHETGNISLASGGDFTLTATTLLQLFWDGTNWRDGNSSTTPGNVAAVTTQAGTPSSTPGDEGDINIDTTNDRAFIATGSAANTDWRRGDAGRVLLLSGSESADVASVTVSGWPTDNREYKRLILIITGMRGDRAASTLDDLLIQLNGNSTATNYNSQNLYGVAASAIAVEAVGTEQGCFCQFVVGAVNTDSGGYGAIEIIIHRPENTNDKTLIRSSGGLVSETTAELVTALQVHNFELTAAITSIAFLPKNAATGFVIGGAGEPTTLDWSLYAEY